MGKPLCLTVMMFLLMTASSDVEQDRAECADQLVAIAGCLPYVSEKAKTPTPDCCSGLKQVVVKSIKCICVLIKDRNDPNLGLTVNSTLAATLPSTCHVPVNITQCISLLHISPNSTEAKMFEDFAKTAGATTSTAPVSSTGSPPSTGSSTSDVKSDGGILKKKSFAAMELVFGALMIWVLASKVN